MKNKICKISLISLIMVCSGNMPVDARVNVKSDTHRNYADAYNQVANLRYQQEYADTSTTTATTASDTGTLPVAVDDKKLADSILNNSASDVTMSDLESCSMIYPNGVFRWGIPESGVRRNQTNQCVAVVELRNSNSNAVLATTTVAAGDSMKCNIDMFPQSGWLKALESVELPADEAPTMADVESVMNKEQKQNAGFQIAAGTIIAGVAGNLLSPKEKGSTSLFGTNKTAVTNTFVGAATGAGIMAASAYSGKVAGDTIKSTAVNAASGMVVGNMMAGASNSDSVLATAKCKTEYGEKDCIIGYIETTDKNKTFNNWKENELEDKNAIILINNNNNLLKCEQCNSRQCNESDAPQIVGDFKNCTPISNTLTNIYVKTTNDGSISLNSAKNTDFDHINQYKLNSKDQVYVNAQGNDEDAPVFYEVADATVKQGNDKPAYAVFENQIPTKALGYTRKDWTNLETMQSPRYFARNSDGSLGYEFKNTNSTEYKFEPASRDSSSGGLIDLSNEARAKGTLAGTAAGGALGGFAGYQGAKTEIEQRWVSAIQDYKDSLTNFVCMTGGRYLSPYNSYVEIPELKKSEE